MGVTAAGVAKGEGANGVEDDVLLQQAGAACLEAAGDAGTMQCQDAPGLDMLQTCCESYSQWALKTPPAAGRDYPSPSIVTRGAAGKVRCCH